MRVSEDDPSAQKFVVPPLAAAERARAPKTSERVAREIATLIRDQELPEGFRLPVEREMVEMFRIGRTTLREALRYLETRGIVEVRPGPTGGPVVRRPRPSDLSAALSLMLEFKSASLAEVVETRYMIEPAMAGLAATNMTKEAVAALRESVESQRATQNRDVWLHHSGVFHSILAQSCGNVVLSVVCETINATLEAAVAPTHIALDDRAIGEHEEILDALEARDRAAASGAMLRHLSRAYQSRSTMDSEAGSQPIRWISG